MIIEFGERRQVRIRRSHTLSIATLLSRLSPVPLVGDHAPNALNHAHEFPGEPGHCIESKPLCISQQALSALEIDVHTVGGKLWPTLRVGPIDQNGTRATERVSDNQTVFAGAVAMTSWNDVIPAVPFMRHPQLSRQAAHDRSPPRSDRHRFILPELEQARTRLVTG